MDLLNKLTIKNLLLNKKRTIVTIIGIILSVALLGAVSSMFFSFRKSLINYETKEQGNYHFALSNVPQEDLVNFKLNKRIEDFYLISNLGYAKLPGIKNESKPYVYVKAFDKKALDNLGIKLIKGRLPENSNEILIPSHLESNGKVKLELSSNITLDIGKRISLEDNLELDQNNPYDDVEAKEDIIDTTIKNYKIVGIIERPIYNIESLTSPGYTLITFMDNNEIREYDIFVKYNKKGLKEPFVTTGNIIGIDGELYNNMVNPNKSKELSHQEIEKIINSAKYNVLSNDYLITLETGITGDSTIEALLVACIIVVVIIIFTSVFCIKNSFDISITERIREYGMLSSIGATKKQIRKNVYYEAIILGLIGIPLGILGGIFASYILLIISDYLITGFRGSGFDLKFSFSFVAIFLTVVLGFITILLSSRKSAKKASKISPIMAIRNSEDLKIKSKKIKNSKIIDKLFGIGGEISYKNLKRNKKKYRTTVISIIVCSSVFIALSYFSSTLLKTLELDYKTYNYNILLIYKDSDLTKEKVNEIENLENNIKYVNLTNNNLLIPDYESKYSTEYKKLIKNNKIVNGYSNITIDGKTIEADILETDIIDKEAFENYVKTLNLDYEHVKKDGILINLSYAYATGNNNKIYEVEKYNFKKGDTIKGNLSFDEKQNCVVNLAAVTNTKPFYVPVKNYEPILILNDEYYDFKNSYHIIYIESNDASKTEKDIINICNNSNCNINNLDKNLRQVKSLFLLIGIFLYGFITVIALIGITNIFNTITTNMDLRRREFAMLKSIGMTNYEFNRMIRLESIFYGTKSLFIGIPLSLVLSYIIYKVFQSSDNLLKFQIPYKAIIITCIVVYIIIFIIMKYSIKKINKQNIIETIRNENI